MAGSTAQVEVTDTPVDLTGALSDNVSGYSIAVRVPSDASESVYLGFADDIDTTTGFERPAGSEIAYDLYTETLYAVCATGPVTVHVSRTGV